MLEWGVRCKRCTHPAPTNHCHTLVLTGRGRRHCPRRPTPAKRPGGQQYQGGAHHQLVRHRVQKGTKRRANVLRGREGREGAVKCRHSGVRTCSPDHPPPPRDSQANTQTPAQAATPSPSPTHPLAGEPAVEKVGDGGCREDGRAQRGRGRWGRPKPGWWVEGVGGGGVGRRWGVNAVARALRHLGPCPPARSHRRPAQARQRRGRA